MHCSLFKDMHFVLPGVLTMLATDLLKHNNPISTFLISSNMSDLIAS